MALPEDLDLQLHRQSTAEVVADTVVRLIVSGKFRAGEPLRESYLARQLGISRSSVREGLRLLEQSGLVAHEMHRGAVVTTPTLEGLEDLYKARMYIEIAAVQQGSPSEARLQRIKDALQELNESAVSKDAARIISADLDLHEAFTGLLGNKRVSAFYSQIRREMLFLFTVLSYTDKEYLYPPEVTGDRHQDICQAIFDGRRDDAASLLRAHITMNLERLQEILRASEERESAK